MYAPRSLHSPGSVVAVHASTHPCAASARAAFAARCFATRPWCRSSASYHGPIGSTSVTKSSPSFSSAALAAKEATAAPRCSSDEKNIALLYCAFWRRVAARLPLTSQNAPRTCS
uniref:Uncharacterized protein n=1 Tax=Mantoniella antarctica TaxID=81844 RepID=A0A7S0X3E9_9CHLO